MNKTAEKFKEKSKGATSKKLRDSLKDKANKLNNNKSFTK